MRYLSIESIDDIRSFMLNDKLDMIELKLHSTDIPTINHDILKCCLLNRCYWQIDDFLKSNESFINITLIKMDHPEWYLYGLTVKSLQYLFVFVTKQVTNDYVLQYHLSYYNLYLERIDPIIIQDVEDLETIRFISRMLTDVSILRLKHNLFNLSTERFMPIINDVDYVCSENKFFLIERKIYGLTKESHYNVTDFIKSDKESIALELEFCENGYDLYLKEGLFEFSKKCQFLLVNIVSQKPDKQKVLLVKKDTSNTTLQLENKFYEIYQSFFHNEFEDVFEYTLHCLGWNPNEAIEYFPLETIAKLMNIDLIEVLKLMVESGLQRLELFNGQPIFVDTEFTKQYKQKPAGETTLWHKSMIDILLTV